MEIVERLVLYLDEKNQPTLMLLVIVHFLALFAPYFGVCRMLKKLPFGLNRAQEQESWDYVYDRFQRYGKPKSALLLSIIPVFWLFILYILISSIL